MALLGIIAADTPLLLVAFAAVFTGTKASMFTLGMARLNKRIQTQLFHLLLRQGVGFFDTTKTGTITSWLAVDTTTVAEDMG
ncbi:hypothetical protein WJX82_003500 [Trebouxia sp. C0006]